MLPHRGLRLDVRAALGGRASASLVGSLERMLEPDPDLRSKSLASALDGPSAGSVVPPARSAVGGAKEDAAVKSIRNLLWLLWGLGWVIVPLLLKQFSQQQLIPLVMFGSLGALFVVTWHKGALIRAMLRAVLEPRTRTTGVASLTEGTPRQRVASARDAAQQQVRVHTSELLPEELVGQTERKEPAAVRARERPRP